MFCVESTKQRVPLGFAMAVAFASLGLGTSARADCEPDPYVGSICITAATYCPEGYAEMDGQLLSIAQYNLLYAVVGTTYGGNGQSTVGIPNGKGRTLIGEGRGPGLDYYPLGAYDGIEKRLIGEHQLPIHSHGATFTPAGTAVSQKVAVQAGSADAPSSGDYKGITTKGSANVAAYIGSSSAGSTVQLGGWKRRLPPRRQLH